MNAESLLNLKQFAYTLQTGRTALRWTLAGFAALLFAYVGSMFVLRAESGHENANIATASAGPFGGPMIVSMRPMKPADAIRGRPTGPQLRAMSRSPTSRSPRSGRPSFGRS